MESMGAPCSRRKPPNTGHSQRSIRIGFGLTIAVGCPDGLPSPPGWANIEQLNLLNGCFAMTTAILDAKTQEFDVEDIEYLRHGDKPLLARVYKPHGEGPFPALVECHGGAWCLQDRHTEKLRHQAMV